MICWRTARVGRSSPSSLFSTSYWMPSRWADSLASLRRRAASSCAHGLVAGIAVGDGDEVDGIAAFDPRAAAPETLNRNRRGGRRRR